MAKDTSSWGKETARRRYADGGKVPKDKVEPLKPLERQPHTVLDRGFDGRKPIRIDPMEAMGKSPSYTGNFRKRGGRSK